MKQLAKPLTTTTRRRYSRRPEAALGAIALPPSSRLLQHELGRAGQGGGPHGLSRREALRLLDSRRNPRFRRI